MSFAPGKEAEWHTRDERDNFVYILAHIDGDGEVVGACKIGITNDPYKRLKQIRYELRDNSIVLLTNHAFWKRSHAYAVEQAFHRACHVARVEGEWFDLPPCEAIVLMTECLKAFAAGFLGADPGEDTDFAYDYMSVPGERHIVENPVFFPRPRRDAQ